MKLWYTRWHLDGILMTMPGTLASNPFIVTGDSANKSFANRTFDDKMAHEQVERTALQHASLHAAFGHSSAQAFQALPAQSLSVMPSLGCSRITGSQKTLLDATRVFIMPRDPLECSSRGAITCKRTGDVVVPLVAFQQEDCCDAGAHTARGTLPDALQ